MPSEEAMKELVEMPAAEFAQLTYDSPALKDLTWAQLAEIEKRRKAHPRRPRRR